MKENWRIKEVKKEKEASDKNKRLFPELEKAIEDILVKRGIDTPEKKEEFLHPDYKKNTYDPNLLSDMDRAVERVLQARKDKELICVYGDYDVDGITSSTILHDFFQQIGIKSFTYLPDRNKEGYGLNKKAIDYILEQGADLIITVDCGITGAKEVEYAREKNLDVVITDHHFVPEEIPRAVAVVNPKKPGDKYPEKMLAGVGVAFKLIEAVAQRIEGYDLEQLKWLLDLVAVGSVADCVPLLGENRTLTKFGLIVLARTRRTGLKQLFEVGRVKISPSQLPTGEQISFQVAPRINAAGRMDHASAAYELLIKNEEERVEARSLALDIESQNQHRQKVTQEIIKEVEGKLDKKNLPAVIIDYSEHWSLGVVGLVAGKIADKHNRPCILLKEKDGLLKGSCRSVPAFHLMEALTKLKDLLEGFGGHSQAAGITVKKENFAEFKKRFTELVAEKKLGDIKKSVDIDERIKIDEINEKLLDELMLMEPFGQGNKKPQFLSENVVIQKIAYLGADQQHLKMWIADSKDSPRSLELITFNYKNNLEIFTGDNEQAGDNKEAGDNEQATGEKQKNHLQPGNKINIVYTLQENIWNGHRSIQGRIVDLEIGDKEI